MNPQPKNFSIIFFLSASTILASFIAGFFFVQNTQLRKQLAQNQTPSPSPTPTETPTPTGYTCPTSGWVDCMPILDSAKQKACSAEAIVWYKDNCPDYKGVAL